MCLNLTNQRSSARAAGLLVVLAVALLPHRAIAHQGIPVAPHDVASAWEFDPLVIIGLFVAGYLYLRGTAKLWRRAGVGIGVRPWQAATFVAGLLALAIALIGPLDQLGLTLFSAHMVQHLTITMAAPPLLVIGAPLTPLIWAMPKAWRREIARSAHVTSQRSVVRAFRSPVSAVALATGVLWLWHIPVLYEAAVRSQAVHVVEHATLFGSAMLFWWVVLRPSRGNRSGYGVSVLAVFAMAMAGSALGALLTTSPTAWYSVHAPGTALWNMTTMEDQELAGIIMWVPAGAIYLLAALWLISAWLDQIEHRSILRNARLPVPAAMPGAKGRTT